MPACNFKFGPESTTMIVTSRALPSYRPFTATFTTLVETSLSLSGTITFPLAFAISGALAVPVHTANENCDAGGANGIGTSNVPPDHGGTEPGQAKKTCATNSTIAPVSTATATGATQSPTSAPPIPLIQPAATSRGLNTSQPTQSASTNRPGSPTGGQLPSNAQSLDLQETTSGSATPSFPASSSDPLFASSDPTANQLIPSTPPVSTPRHPSSSSSSSSSSSTATATPASGLGVGSAIGIALGVFAGAAVLVASAVLLFLSLRNRRTRRGGRRDSCSAASTQSSASTEKRRLRPTGRPELCEGSPSRHGTPSSTWSWFATLSVSSESQLVEDRHRYGYGYGYGDTRASSVNSRTRDDMDPDPFQCGDRLGTDELEESADNSHSWVRTPASPQASSPNPTAPQLRVEREREVPMSSHNGP